MYQIVFSKKANKSLQKIPTVYLIRIKRKLALISKEPYSGKKLEGDLADKYSVRAWPYRIIYSIRKDKLIVEVLKIEHRQGVYKH